MKKKLLFVEFGNAHEDGFYSHLKMLEEHFLISLLVNEKLKDKLPNTIQFESVHTIPCDNRSPLLCAFTSLLFILKNKYAFVFFHTAQGNIVKNLCLLLLPTKVFCFGVHHNAIKLIDGSLTQKIITLKIKHYFVLADFIKSSLNQNNLKPSIQIESFYPCYYEKPQKIPPINKAPYSIHIAIPGTIEQSRRDFFGLLDILEANPLNSNIKFVVLGNSRRGDGPKIKSCIKKLNLESNFIFFDAYVTAEQMYAHIQCCDMIAPLMHPNLEYFFDYTTFKITGSFNLAYGFKKTLFLFESLAERPDFKHVSIGYNAKNLVDKLNFLASNKDEILKTESSYKDDKRFHLQFQKEKYKNFMKKMEII